MLVAVFLAGLRHGFDIDHVAAITDITASQSDRRRAMVLGTVYAVGHALVLIVFGGVAVIAGERIPESFDETMGRVIGATLIVLGLYVAYSLLRYGREARFQSPWMVVLAWVKKMIGWRRGPDRTDRHPHRHSGPASVDRSGTYGIWTCLAIGMIHGVGAETPSQIALFTAAAGVSSILGGIPILIAFVAGLLLGNSLLVAAGAAGFSAGRKLPRVYVAIAALSALVSLGVGWIYLVG